MTFSIESLSEPELVELNRRIVERLRLLRQNRSQNQMLLFHVGEKVCFHDHDGKLVTGVVERFNKKSVTVFADESKMHWRVHPGLLRKLADASLNAMQLVGK